MSGGSLTLLKDDSLELFPLPLGSQVSSQTSLQEFQSSLFTGDLQEFHCTSFIGSKANDFPHDISDEFVVSCDALDEKRRLLE